MDLLPLLLLLCAGCAAGFLAGFFGIGGGILLVPILLYYYQSVGVSSLIATHLAFGTSLLVIVCSASSSAFQYQRGGFVVWRAVLFLGAAGAVGALAGALIAGALQARTLKVLFAILVLFSALRLLARPRKPRESPPGPLLWLKLSGAGLFIGLASALAGVGGGVLAVPILYSLLKFPFKKSLGTSSATIVVTSLAAAAGYAFEGWHTQGLPGHTLGYLDYVAAVPLALGAVPLAMAGAAAAERTKAETLRKIFAVLLVALAAKIFLG